MDRALAGQLFGPELELQFSPSLPGASVDGSYIGPYASIHHIELALYERLCLSQRRQCASQYRTGQKSHSQLLCLTLFELKVTHLLQRHRSQSRKITHFYEDTVSSTLPSRCCFFRGKKERENGFLRYYRSL